MISQSTLRVSVFSVYMKNHNIRTTNRYIQDKHPHSSGIVYCLSRKEVERVAGKLSEKIRGVSGTMLVSRIRTIVRSVSVDGQMMSRKSWWQL